MSPVLNKMGRQTRVHPKVWFKMILISNSSNLGWYYINHEWFGMIVENKCHYMIGNLETAKTCKHMVHNLQNIVITHKNRCNLGTFNSKKTGDDPKQLTYFIQQAINTLPAEMKIYCRFNRKSCGQQTNIDIPNRSRVAEDAAKSNTLPNSIASMRWISARNKRITGLDWNLMLWNDLPSQISYQKHRSM